MVMSTIKKTLVTTGLTLVLKETISALKQKENTRQNQIQTNGNYDENFQIGVAKPEILILKIGRSGIVTVELQGTPSQSIKSHIEGSIRHVGVNGDTLYQRSYRSDKGGYSATMNVSLGDTLVISMEAHHGVSAVFKVGHAKMDVKMIYARYT